MMCVETLDNILTPMVHDYTCDQTHSSYIPIYFPIYLPPITKLRVIPSSTNAFFYDAS